MKSDNQAIIGKHAFEVAGLGAAPFKFIGFFESVYQATPDAPRQPGTNCDYCGTGIMMVCSIRSADGKVSKVGCNCVEKVGDAGIIGAYKKSAEYRAMQRDKRAAKDVKVQAEWAALMADPAVVAMLKSATFEIKRWNGTIDTVTVYDDFTQCWRMCGMAGRARYLGYVKKRIAAANK